MTEGKPGPEPKAEEEKRSANICFRVRPATKRRLRRTAVLLGMSASDTARRAFAIGMKELEKNAPNP